MVPHDPATAREVLLMHASVLIGRQVREQFWTRIGGLGIIVFTTAQLAHLGLTLGYLDPRTFFSPDLIGASQALSLLIFVFTAGLFLAGRLRLVRSEIDLLRLRIEMLAPKVAVEGEPQPDSNVPRARVRPPRRRINLTSTD